MSTLTPADADGKLAVRIVGLSAPNERDDKSPDPT